MFASSDLSLAPRLKSGYGARPPAAGLPDHATYAASAAKDTNGCSRMKLLLVQDRKRALAQHALARSDDEQRAVRLDDLRLLFS